MRIPKQYLLAIIIFCLLLLSLKLTGLTAQDQGPDIEQTRIMPEKEDTSMQSNGQLTVVFLNNAGYPLNVSSIRVIDDVDSKVRCGVDQEMDVQPGDMFKATIEGCGLRDPGEEFNLKVRIIYQSQGRQQQETGILGGIVE